MKKNYKELMKNIALIAVGNFASKILIFLLISLYTRYLSTAEYGLYDLAYTTIQLMFPILTLGATESIMYFLLKKKMGEEDVFSINIKFIIIASIIFSAFLVINYIFKIFVVINHYILYVSIFYFVYCLNNCLIQFAKGINKIKIMTIAGVLGTVSMLTFNILLLVVFKIGLSGYFIANILGLLIPDIYLLISLKCLKYFKVNNGEDNYRKIILFSLPLIVNTLSWWVNNAADRYIISIFDSIESNGLLSVAYKIPSILTAVSAIFIQAWQISVIKEHDEDSKIFYSNLFFIFNGILIIITCGLIVFVKPIAYVMFANEFYNAWILVPFLLISSLFNQNSGYLGAILIADGNSKGISISALIGIVFNIGLNILFVILWGPLGITIATMISSLTIFIMRQYFSKNIIVSKKYPLIVISWVLLIINSVLIIKTNNYIIPVAVYITLIIIYKDIFKYCIDFIKKKVVKNGKKNN